MVLGHVPAMGESETLAAIAACCRAQPQWAEETAATRNLMNTAKMLEANPTLIERLSDPGYGAVVQRGVIITVEGYDWNCPQHITPRFTEAEIVAAVAPLHARIAELEAALAQR